MEQKSSPSKWFCCLPIAYVLIAYSYIFIPILTSRNGIFPLSRAPLPRVLNILFNCRLLIFAVLNLTITVRQAKKLSREQLFNCAVLVKYSLIPLYLFGSFLILAFVIVSFFPLPGVILLGPVMALAISLGGWLILLGGAPFSIAYLLKAKNSGALNTPGAIAAILMQFFFVVDAAVIMFFSFREKRWRKLTLAILMILIAIAVLLFLSIAISLAKAM